MPASGATTWPLALALARRELRGGLKGFRIFLACLLLGVAVIAAAGSVASSVRGGIAADGQKILGGDVEIRLLYRPATPEQIAYFNASGPLSAIREMRAMARPLAGDQRTLVELKGVDAAYPLYGAAELQPAQSLADALALHGGRWGAVADPNLLERLGLKVHDTIHVGAADYESRAALLEMRCGQSLYKSKDDREKVEYMIAAMRAGAPDSLRALFNADSVWQTKRATRK